MPKTTLYRFLDVDENVLYIGVTTDMGKRLQAHEKRDWWPDVAEARLEHFDTLDEALAAEKEAIYAEGPRHNVQHNKARVDRRKTARAKILEGNRLGVCVKCYEVAHKVHGCLEIVARDPKENLVFRLCTACWVDMCFQGVYDMDFSEPDVYHPRSSKPRPAWATKVTLR